MLFKSKVDEVIEQDRLEKEKQDEIIKNLKLVSKEIFNSKNGKYFLKYLKTICLWSEQDLNINEKILIYKKGRRDIWTIIRNILPKDILAQIEIYDEEKE